MSTVKVTGHPRLYRRGARYYHRAAIPQDIQDSYPKAEETFSLNTANYHEALRLVRKAAVEVDRKFDKHRRWVSAQAKPLDKLTEEQIDHLASLYHASLLDEDEDIRTEGIFEEEPGEPGTDWERWDFDEYAEDIEDSLTHTRHLYARGKADAFFKDEAEDLLSWDGVELALSPDSPSWRPLVRAIQAAYIRAGKDQQARNEGEVVPTPTVAKETLQRPQSSPSDGQGPLLSVLAEDWIAEKFASWATKTTNDHRTTIHNFINVAGDKPLAAYSKADGRAFKSTLLKLPSNWTKQVELKGLSVDRAAERANELGMAPMSAKNVNKLIGYAAAFWNWAAKQYDECPPNPLNGLKVTLKKRAREERDPFTLSELQAIFQAPVFTGCKSLHFWKQPGSLVPKNSGMYWAPLVALFTGARMGEVLQLYVSDVKQTDGIDIIDINGDGDDKKLKNSGSRRQTPVHPELKRLGFLEHVQKMRQQGSKRVFPDMPMGSDGYYSSVYSKRFISLLVNLKIKRKENAFHSLRHNFEDACRNSGISKDVMNALQGHSEVGMSGRYGAGYSLDVLYEAMCQLEYKGLDLSHLYSHQH
ncbi:site-specific integrase [Halomonas sp. SH5A2]|uniref:site-specific integrase n=1 Tax=Halomonas sp. SH5A2 TaxID=2749040 RepID=UPI00163F193B|nr:site-specific integrase [Halomonas sp. SH5A2]QNI03073.1 site-specific integrase [Halomonas sp. SH5A2]